MESLMNFPSPHPPCRIAQHREQFASHPRKPFPQEELHLLKIEQLCSAVQNARSIID